MKIYLIKHKTLGYVDRKRLSIRGFDQSKPKVFDTAQKAGSSLSHFLTEYRNADMRKEDFTVVAIEVALP
jgi:hypothetical protein